MNFKSISELVMRDCALALDMALVCNNSKGGMKKMYIIELANLGAITATLNSISAIANPPGKKFRLYDLVRSTAEAEQDLQTNAENGTSHCVQSIKIALNTVSAAVSNELKAVVANRLAVVVVDRNNNGWLYGKDYGITSKTVKAKTGKVGGDRNGYELEMDGDEDEYAWYVPSSLFAALTVVGA